jgi:hypothetical protein
MLARRQVRLAAVSALQLKNAADALGWTIQSPGDTATPPAKLPAVLVRTGGDRKASNGPNVPQFDTGVALEIEGRIAPKNTAEAAQDAIEAMGYAVETALLNDYWLNRIVQNWSSIDTEQEITSDGRQHLGGFRMTLSLECFEVFDPVQVPPPDSAWPPAPPAASADLQEVQLHVDAVNVFDQSGTYANPPFPAAVQPAPRTSGPDGRDEIGADIDLT